MALILISPFSNVSFFRSPWAHIDYEAFKLSTTMTLQSLVKHILTEGDKIIISWFSPLQDQGGYALAVNYGDSFGNYIFKQKLKGLSFKARSSLASYSNLSKRPSDCSSLEHSIPRKRSKDRLSKPPIPFTLFFQYKWPFRYCYWSLAQHIYLSFCPSFFLSSILQQVHHQY